MRGAEYGGYNWIFRTLDVGTGLGTAAAQKGKSSTTTGQELAHVWAQFGCPSILQMDNGTEFLGNCTELALTWSPGNVKIIHGRLVLHDIDSMS